MTVPTSPAAVGLSVGTSTLVAVTSDRTVTSRPVITRAGLPIDDFVTRVGDPVGIVAADGSLHSAAALLADALHDLARTATRGRPLPHAATVAYPAHWKPIAVESLDRALRRIPAWQRGIPLVPDYAAALTALRSDPGLPARGVIAVCDFGAGATTVTLVDAADGLTAIGEPVRCPEFGGDLIDRVLLSGVLTGAGIGPDGTGTWSMRALNQLRTDCRSAKERLSTLTATTVPGEPAGVRGGIRLTRQDIDGAVRSSLTDVVDVLRECLQRNGIQFGDLVAVASVGGTAAVPAVTATLSAQLRAPVITTARPGVTAATGAALRAARKHPDPGASAITRVQGRPSESAPAAAALAWSQAADLPELVPQKSSRAQRRAVRPELNFAHPPARPDPAPAPWHRRPLVLTAVVLGVIAGAGGATALALRSDTHAAPAVSGPANGEGALPGLPTAIPLPQIG
jgi:molecular chaperone DnaK (HSP70)